jgi:hypothetical protein
MPRYFFHVDDGGSVIHVDEGVVLFDLDDARLKAIRTFGEMGRSGNSSMLKPCFLCNLMA